MELIIKLMLGAASFGAMSWFIWGSASYQDTELVLMATVLGLVSFVHAFLALAKIIHYSQWGASIFWLGMLATLAYTFPPFGHSQFGWFGWAIIAFLAVGALFIVTYQPTHGGKKASASCGYVALGENGYDEGINYSGYPTEKALRRGLD
jgi:peptidoglycan/LPS O-acetylase OafA/YrhL